MRTRRPAYEINLWLIGVTIGLGVGGASGEEVAPAQEPTASSANQPATFVRSVVPTPVKWSGAEVTAAFKLASTLVPTICLPDPVDWFAAEGKSAEQSKPHKDAQWQKHLLTQEKLGAFIQIDPYKNRRGPIPNLPKAVGQASFADSVLRKGFIADAVHRVELFHPAYLVLAMEINAYYEENPKDFDNFVSLFAEAREAVRKVDPKVMVLVSFQYEQLLGLYGGQGHLPKHGPQWDLFAKFEPYADAMGISSYPMKTFSPSRFDDPNALPDDYYTRIAQHTKKPIVFSELGWPSDPRFGGSPEKQAAFIRRFPSLIRGMDVRLVNWYFLHDAKGYGEVFESMGLVDSAGHKKPAFDAWSGR